MFSIRNSSILATAAALLSACGGGTVAPPPPPPPGTLPTPSVACAAQPVTTLAAGAHQVLDASQANGCLRVPAAGAAGAQYLVTLASTSSTRTATGVQAPYIIQSSFPAASSAPPAGAPAAAPQVGPRNWSDLLARPPMAPAVQFDHTLRELERTLAADARARGAVRTAAPVTAAPQVGDVRTFKACGSISCASFVNVTATAKYVGTHSAIFLDNAAPTADPFQQADFDDLGGAFDNRHYPIDTTAFGRESDVDGNGLVIILMTKAVNDLTPDCTNGRVVGYFFGGDLTPGFANSNNGEVFYTLVSAPATPTCTVVTRRAAVDNLKPTLVHEFQHMISFNQHTILRTGTAEATWLNEALSHYAEELGGRLIPATECPNFPSCRSQYTSGDIINAYDYLKNPESHFLIIPNSSSGTLEERGSGWLFLRWALDQYSPDPPLSTTSTRAIVGTAAVSVANLTGVLGSDFSTMVPEWLMASYLDDDGTFTDPTGRLQFTSWGLRAIWTDPRNASVFPGGFPIVPEVLGSGYSHSGVLRGGSGALWVINQVANGPAVDVRAVANTTGAALDPTLVARYGITRIR